VLSLGWSVRGSDVDLQARAAAVYRLGTILLRGAARGRALAQIAAFAMSISGVGCTRTTHCLSDVVVGRYANCGTAGGCQWFLIRTDGSFVYWTSGRSALAPLDGEWRADDDECIAFSFTPPPVPPKEHPIATPARYRSYLLTLERLASSMRICVRNGSLSLVDDLGHEEVLVRKHSMAPK
jgi:hypothetical protein